MYNELFKGSVQIIEIISVSRSSVELEVEVSNQSDQTWKSTEDNPVLLSYHWLDEKWTMLVYEGVRTELPNQEIEPGTSTRTMLKITPPELPGQYYLMVTLLKEGISWFEANETFSPEIIKITIPDEI